MKEEAPEVRRNNSIANTFCTSLSNSRQHSVYSRSDEIKNLELRQRVGRVSSTKNLFIIRTILIAFFVMFLVGAYKLYNMLYDDCSV